jgi:hypothetical protein
VNNRAINQRSEGPDFCVGRMTDQLNRVLCMILGFRSEVRGICALLGYYAAYIGKSLRTFRDNLLVPSSKVKKSKKDLQLPPLRRSDRLRRHTINRQEIKSDSCQIKKKILCIKYAKLSGSTVAICFYLNVSRRNFKMLHFRHISVDLLHRKGTLLTPRCVRSAGDSSS